MLIGIMHLIADSENPYGIVSELLDAVPAGSYLALSHPAKDINADIVAEGAKRYNQRVATSQTRRTFSETERFFAGLDLVEPGVVQCHRWRPDDVTDLDREVSCYGAVGSKSG
jgi:Protein of unknown function (DUF574).